MGHKQSLALILGTAIGFAGWELIGHRFLMAIPMNARHGLDVVVGTTLALLIAAVAIKALQRQQKELTDLARLRDYLLRMQEHYLRLSPLELTHPNQQLEYRTLELKYADIQQQLAEERPEMRAKALLDLTELALTHLPGMHEPYPFFVRAHAHLAAALTLESEMPPREQAIHGLEMLAAFARDNDPRLLDPLIEDLAHANRTSLRGLTDALSERFAASDNVPPDELAPTLMLVRFTETQAGDAAVLEDILESAPYREALAAHRVLLNVRNTETTDAAEQLNAIRVAATSLRDTRDSLAQAICALPQPPDFPKESAERRFWKRSVPLRLNACFLAGAKLDLAQMQGVDLHHAYLQAAALRDAQMHGADLSDANLWKAQIFGGGLEYAKLWGANLREASLTATHLEGADLSRALLQGAHLTGAQLRNTCLWQVKVADDTLKQKNSADFARANWWDARFTDILSGSTDSDLQRWLKYMFPQPLPDGTAAPRVPDNPFTHAADDFGTLILKTSAR